jgi:O-antigen ligase
VDESDLIGRLTKLLQIGGGFGIALLCLLLIPMILLAVMNKRTILIGMFLFALMFTGSIIPGLDAGSTLFRWGIMFLLAGTMAFGASSPGWPAITLGIVGILCMFWGFNGARPFYSFQKSLLYVVMMLPMASALADQVQSREDVKRFLRMFLWPAGIYVMTAMISLPGLRSGERFGGATGGVPLFALVGGFLVPFLLWGVFNEESRGKRLYCIVILVCTSMVLVLSAQRTGTFAGFIACLPLLARINFKKVLGVAVLLMVAAAMVYLALMLLPLQAAYIKERFISTDVTGRTEIWRYGLEACLQSPLTGRGMGMGSSIFMGTARGLHSTYLAVWAEGGLPCLILFGVAYLGLAWRAVALILFQKDSQTKDIGRLLLGLVLGSIAAGWFEESIFSPSNLPSFIGVAASVVSARLISICRTEAWAGRYLDNSILPAADPTEPVEVIRTP